MSIFTIGNKPICCASHFTDPFYKEWLEDRTTAYPVAQTLQECSKRYLCFTCDFITSLGSSSDFDSRLSWIYVEDGDAKKGGTSLFFKKSSNEAFPSFNNITIPDVDLTVKNNIKYVFDFDEGELFFFFNGVLIGSKKPFSYIREIFSVYHSNSANLKPVDKNNNADAIITSNAKVFHCDTFKQAKKWTGSDGAVGTTFNFAVNGVNLS